MSFVNLVSGGLDSTLIGVMAKEENIDCFPLFIDYGQRAADREWEACQIVHSKFGLQEPVKMNLSGYGHVIASGLTRKTMDIKANAFTPGRNLMFLLMGSAYAYQQGLSSVSIGLLSEQFSLFPDQKIHFITHAEVTISMALGKKIELLTPLIEYTKADVINLAQLKGIEGTYSCHAGKSKNCGVCISCMEFQFDEEN